MISVENSSADSFLYIIIAPTYYKIAILSNIRDSNFKIPWKAVLEILSAKYDVAIPNET
jgi:hypothetical protein